MDYVAKNALMFVGCVILMRNVLLMIGFIKANLMKRICYMKHNVDIFIQLNVWIIILNLGIKFK